MQRMNLEGLYKISRKRKPICILILIQAEAFSILWGIELSKRKYTLISP